MLLIGVGLDKHICPLDRMEKAENRKYKTVSKWMYSVGIPAGVLGLVLVVGALMEVIGILPSSEVQKGSEVSSFHLNALQKNEIIEPDEGIEYFYSNGFLSIIDEGSLLTDRRVITYFTDEDEDNELKIYALYLSDIASVELLERGTFMRPSTYKVINHEGNWLPIVVSAENRGDHKFVRALQSKITSE